jgi:hypothetical protein
VLIICGSPAKVIDACRRADVWFSVTCRKDSKIRAAVAAIPETSWTAIPHWSTHVDLTPGKVVDSHADVAETPYTAFGGSKHPVTARLVVRRVRRLRPRARPDRARRRPHPDGQVR